MSSLKFEEISKEILNNDNLTNLQTIKENRNLISQTLLAKHKELSSFDTKNCKLKERTQETREEIDQRVKGYNELQERLRKFIKTTRKKFKPTVDEHCKVHKNVMPTNFLDRLNNFLDKDLSVPDIHQSLRSDEETFMQHASNIESLNKLIESVKEHKIKEATLPSAKEVNDSVKLLCEIVSDVDCLNESSTMYNGLSGKSPNVGFEEEIKDLTDKLFIP
ncbi:hypothetical protein Bhyg_02420 [Pseudolycoriella hygida]|uniref:Uncharacterized protein n=1 Tax=Pseudolycoriella hygida TaxID=35572 RepID=A0A9Q0S8J1_9DIPT|nr:hypothetical protein Bhyg_02420 [Pseudolycoriella hygida]